MFSAQHFPACCATAASWGSGLPSSSLAFAKSPTVHFFETGRERYRVEQTPRSQVKASQRRSGTVTVLRDAWCLKTALRPFPHYFTGTSTGAPLSFTKNTTNFAGLVLLAFRPMT